MKFDGRQIEYFVSWSLPVRGAWIEIALDEKVNALMESLPVRGAWIEIGGNINGNMKEDGRSP